MRGFFLRGAGVGASPLIQLGICVESSDAGATGTAGFFFGAPKPSDILFLRFPKFANSDGVNLHISVGEFRSLR